jgi:hypothetical protein
MKQSSLLAFCKKPVAIGVTSALIAMSSTQVQAAVFSFGDIDVTFDSTFSYGASMRVEDRDWDNHVAKSSHPRVDWSGYHIALNQYGNAGNGQADVWQLPGSFSNNSDNGNLNYDAGDTFSKMFKGLHELDVRYGDYGVFVRGMYFYDFEMMDEDRAWTNSISPNQGANDPCRDEKAKEFLCRDVRLLDAFFYADFEIDDMPLSVRVGDQVISWGESALIAHGISELNAVDFARLKAPGAELKEAFIPAGAIWASLGVTENFNIEAFYQYRWEETVLPVAGSYFSTNDFAGDGGYFNNVQFGFGSRPDHDLDYLINSMNQIGAMLGAGQIDQETATAMYLAHPTKIAVRGKGSAGKIDANDGGEYGLRFSWYLPELNDTEISLYHFNYHSRRPLVSGTTSNFSAAALGADLGMLVNGIDIDNYTELNAFTKGVLVFPEDIKAYALSFNTNIGTTALAGEIIFRQDEPLQIDDVELLYAAMPQQLAHESTPESIRRTDLSDISQMLDANGNPYGPGETAQGYIERDTTQAQFTLTHLFGPMLGASQFTTLLEMGAVSIHDMPEHHELRLNGPGTSQNGGIEGKEGLEPALQGGRESNPFPDDFAWGYKFVAKLDYADVFMGWNMSPRIVFSHDVEGITPDPIFLFVEERKSVAATLSFDYQSRWSADFSYNAFWDGVGTTNQLEDRDFVSFNIKYSI